MKLIKIEFFGGELLIEMKHEGAADIVVHIRLLLWKYLSLFKGAELIVGVRS